MPLLFNIYFHDVQSPHITNFVFPKYRILFPNHTKLLTLYRTLCWNAHFQNRVKGYIPENAAKLEFNEDNTENEVEIVEEPAMPQETFDERI